MTARQRFTRRLADRLTQRRADHLERALTLPKGIDFTSNDYLGLARLGLNDPDSLSVPENMGATASRLLRGNHKIHTETEAKIAEFSGTESSLLFSSGFSLNVGLYSAISDKNDTFFSDALNHASIIDGLRLSKARKVIFPHQDLETLEILLRQRQSEGQAFVVTESLFSMDGDITDLQKLAELCEAHDALLIVDEAHATGLFGKRGSGLIEQQGVREKMLLSIHTAGKALGIQGAWVAADKTIIQHLVNHCRSFIYSTGISPNLAQALLSSPSGMWSPHQIYGSVQAKMQRTLEYRQSRETYRWASVSRAPLSLSSLEMPSAHSRSQSKFRKRDLMSEQFVPQPLLKVPLDSESLFMLYMIIRP